MQSQEHGAHDVTSMERQHQPSRSRARINLALVGIIGGVLVLAGSPPVVVAVLEVVLILAGGPGRHWLNGGHCPLYAWLALRTVQVDRRS